MSAGWPGSWWTICSSQIFSNIVFAVIGSPGLVLSGGPSRPPAVSLRVRPNGAVRRPVNAQQPVNRVHVRLGRRDDDVGVGATADICPTVPLDADEHFALGVDALGN